MTLEVGTISGFSSFTMPYQPWRLGLHIYRLLELLASQHMLDASQDAKLDAVLKAVQAEVLLS
jgi:hypothetical protein